MQQESSVYTQAVLGKEIEETKISRVAAKLFGINESIATLPNHPMQPKQRQCSIH
jgi:hypothetical protein